MASSPQRALTPDHRRVLRDLLFCLSSCLITDASLHWNCLCCMLGTDKRLMGTARTQTIHRDRLSFCYFDPSAHQKTAVSKY
ncbi:Tho Complex Subunit 2 [Manis pentadactyla]|nr:Tho Complex Subunit 2 [Manis pentadactyla]